MANHMTKIEKENLEKGNKIATDYYRLSIFYLSHFKRLKEERLKEMRDKVNYACRLYPLNSVANLNLFFAKRNIKKLENKFYNL